VSIPLQSGVNVEGI